MMHVFYCIKCKRYHYTNNQARAVCCGQPMYHVDIEFTDFVKRDGIIGIALVRKQVINFLAKIGDKL